MGTLQLIGIGAIIVIVLIITFVILSFVITVQRRKIRNLKAKEKIKKTTDTVNRKHSEKLQEIYNEKEKIDKEIDNAENEEDINNILNSLDDINNKL